MSVTWDGLYLLFGSRLDQSTPDLHQSYTRGRPEEDRGRRLVAPCSKTLEALPEKVDAVMMIAVVYDTTVGLYTRTVYEVLPAGETAISLDTQTTETGNVAHIYAVPMSLTSTGLSLTGGSDGAENSSDNGYAYTLMMRSDEGSFQYGRSQYLTTLALG